jgi:hypothetical protein
MHVLVATTETQGIRPNDYSWTLEGELVKIPLGRCTKGHVDDDCGCSRGMSGVGSSRASTTIRVADMPWMQRPAYAAALVDSYEREGWLDADDDGEVRSWIERVIDDQLAVAAFLPVGAVLEFRDDEFSVRNVPEARAA